MTTEDDFQNQLDADPDDHDTRAVFGDWLCERDDPRGPGYTVMGLSGVRPVPCTMRRGAHDRRTYWVLGRLSNAHSPYATYGPSCLQGFWFDAVSAPLPHETALYQNFASWGWCYFVSRRGADDACAAAFGRLSEDDREYVRLTAVRRTYMPDTDM